MVRAAAALAAAAPLRHLGLQPGQGPLMLSPLLFEQSSWLDSNELDLLRPCSTNIALGAGNRVLNDQVTTLRPSYEPRVNGRERPVTL